MKKFAIKLITYLAAIAVFDVLLCAIIDPFNVMHTEHIRDNGVQPNNNYIKMSYILHHPDRFDSFVFGSSRVGNIHVENIPDVRCYNMTCSQGTPKEHLANIGTLISAGIVPKKVFLGLDSLSYTVDPARHYTQPIRCPYEYLTENRMEFVKLYFDPAMVIGAVVDVTKGHTPTEGYGERFYRYGWDTDYGYTTTYDFDHASPSMGGNYRMEETLEEIREIVRLCREHGVDLTVFTNPMYSVTYQASLEKNYLEFLEELARITPYYNFSGYNALTTDSGNYIDSSHYTAEVSDMLIDCMCRQARYEELYKDGFGLYVTEDSVDGLMEILRAQTA